MACEASGHQRNLRSYHRPSCGRRKGKSCFAPPPVSRQPPQRGHPLVNGRSLIFLNCEFDVQYSGTLEIVTTFSQYECKTKRNEETANKHNKKQQTKSTSSPKNNNGPMTGKKQSSEQLTNIDSTVPRHHANIIRRFAIHWTRRLSKRCLRQTKKSPERGVAIRSRLA